MDGLRSQARRQCQRSVIVRTGTGRTCQYDQNDHIEDVYKDLEVLGELVDKATPKRAGFMSEAVGECPNCHKILLGAVADYCFHCGQHLDWSEEKENCDEE